MEEIFKLIQNFGFPIAVAIYLLFRQEKKMDDVVENIKGRNGVLDKLDEVKSIIERCMKK